MTETMYTPQEVADSLKVTVETIYDWINAGKFDAVKIGGKFRIYGDSLRQFLDAHRVAKP